MSSLYSQNYYGHPGQPSYNGSSFTPSAIPSGYQYQYQQPQPPPAHGPSYYVDPTTFRRDYAERLSQLTFNSRPIIQSLSMLAQDFSRFSEIVAQCIDDHIRRVPPWMKLPAFYLLDAISKNVYDPYARQFASFVIPLFLETYHQVDQSTKSKMEEMLLTWRTGSPTGKELFGVPPQVAIERGVWGDGGSSHHQSSGIHGPGQITTSQVLSELQFTLGQKERAVQAIPYDTVSQNHVHVLQQLRKLVEAGVSQGELQQILTQLRTLARTTATPVPQAPPAPVQWQPPLSFSKQPAPGSSSLSRTSAYSQVENIPYSADALVKTEVQHSAPVPPFTTGMPPMPPSADIANLLSTLIKAGVVSASGTPVGAGATAKEHDYKPELSDGVDAKRQVSRQYRNSVLSQKIKLTSAEILRTRPRIVELLYDGLAAQCKQCGIRFADTTLGKKNMEDHLDMHFRQNRKANQNTGRGHSRSWFVGVEDWVHDVSGDSKGKEAISGSGRLNAKAVAAEVVKRDADLRAQYVVVPPGDEAKLISCPICKETLKSEFLEDDEDWVWKNAIQKDDRIYHATCHAEAAASTSTLAARLRNETMIGSRSGTPEASSRNTPPPVASKLRSSKSPSPSSLVGTKRKIEPDDPAGPQTEGTPPFKKLALSTS